MLRFLVGLFICTALLLPQTVLAKSKIDKARDYAKIERFSEASQLLDELILDDPLNAKNHYKAALIYEQMGAYRQADRAFRNAAKLGNYGPKIAKSYEEMGYTAIRRGQMGKAQRAFNKATSYPEKEIVARITLKTDIPQIEGDRAEDSVVFAYKIQAKLVAVFKKHGWQADDALEIDPIDAGVIELQLGKGMNLKFKETLRLKAYIYQCDTPMRKYRGGKIGKFFKKDVLEKAEQCFTYDEKLQGKNYPY